MTDRASGSGGGVGGTTLLQLLFIGLKLGHVIEWSWWWVMAPTWITALLAIPIVALFVWMDW